MERKERGKYAAGKNSGQEKAIRFLYESTAGRLILKLLVLPPISRLIGMFLSSRLSCLLIDPFIRKHGIDLDEYEKAKYRSYNDFFIRKIRSELRPVDNNPSHFISPCDSKLTVTEITPESVFTLKNTQYTLSSLLRNERLAAEYTKGYAMIFRLTVDDYHRYCYVDDGTKEENIYIPGVLNTVNPIANDHFPIYKENCREYSVLHSRNYGDIIMMEVGALLVGKIVNHHSAAKVSRGQEKGYFQFGGSTVVLLVKENRVVPDADIMENSKSGIETIVRFGERIGLATKQ